MSLVRNFCAGVNTNLGTVVPSEQPVRDFAGEVVPVRFQINQIAVWLMCERVLDIMRNIVLVSVVESSVVAWSG